MSEISAEAIQEIQKLSIAADAPFDMPAGGHAVLVPAGYQVREFKPIDPPLTHVKQKVRLDDAPSFIAYVGRYKTPNTQLFAELDAGSVTAVIDYHQAPQSNGESVPLYGAHAATYRAKLAEEWARWTQIDNQKISQAQLAEFLEENAENIVEPEAASVLEVARNLKMRKRVKFESGLSLKDGTIQLEYREEVEGAGKEQMAVPDHLIIGVPVYFGGEGFRLKVMMRYRIEEGVLHFMLKIHRREFAVQAAFAQVVKEIAEGVGIAPFYGAPL